MPHEQAVSASSTQPEAPDPRPQPLPPGRIQIEYVDPRSLKADPGNPRVLRRDIEALDTLIRSFDRHGVVDPILARRDGEIVSGHQRVAAAIARGIERVPVVFLDIDAADARELSVALNSHVGTWDDRLLARRLKELETDGLGAFERIGLAGDEIARHLASLDALARRDQPESFDLDEELERIDHPGRIAVGQLWRLGRHHMICGDATDPAVVGRLLDGRRPALTWTDPPYNVSLGTHGGQRRGARRRTMANDALDPVAWAAFVAAFTRLVVDTTDGAIYCAMSSKEWPTVVRGFEEAGGHWSNTLIWAKDRFVLGRASYQHAFEPIWFGWREGGPHPWYGGRDQSDVWSIDRPSDSPLHPVMKPLELIERALEHSSRPGDIVLDPFGGAGSTLIACERTGRTCAMVELDPRYAEVIVRRWERFTGGAAVLVEASDHEGAIR